MSNSEKAACEKASRSAGAWDAGKWANGVTDRGVMHLPGVGAASVCVYIREIVCANAHVTLGF